jgi:hypothetical protein
LPDSAESRSSEIIGASAGFGPIGVKEDYTLPEEPRKTQRLPPISPRFFTPVGGRRPEAKQPEGADKTQKTEATVKLDKPALEDGKRPADK